MALVPVVAVLCTLLAAATAAGQNSFIIPRWRQAPKSLDGQDWLLLPAAQKYSPCHSQYAYDATDVPLPAAKLVSMAFRMARVASDLPSARSSTTFELWHATFAPRSMSPVFANNAGTGAAVVFSGTIDWPARRLTDPPDFVVVVPFQRPFAFIQSWGQSLVVDVKSTLIGENGWLCAAAQRDLGHVDFNNRNSCWIRYQFFYGCGITGGLYPGGALTMDWQLIPPNANCLASLGLQGVGGTWGNLTLPIQLGDGCLWSAASLFFWPFRTDATGRGFVPPLPIPPDPAFGGLELFEQSMCFTPGLNPPGLVTFFSLRLVIGTGDVPNALSMHSYNDVPPRSTCNVWHDQRAPLIQFTYQ